MLRSGSDPEVGFTLLEALITIALVALVFGVVLESFVASNRALQAQARAEERLQLSWKFTTLADVLEGSCSNETVGLKRLYQAEDGIWIPVVDPYSTPLVELQGAAEGFYAGQCPDGSLTIKLVQGGAVKTVRGACQAPRYFHLGHSGLSAYARLYRWKNLWWIEEGAGASRYAYRLGKGEVSVRMLGPGGSPVGDSDQAVYWEIEYTSAEGKKWVMSSWEKRE